MDPGLFAKLRPHVTLYSGLARPNPAYAGKPVLQALGLNEGQVEQMLGDREGADSGPAAPVAAQGSGTYSISSRATRPDGTRVQIQAAIRTGGGGGFGQLYLPLSWRVGETD
jgi:general secretion pathway protein K